MNRIHKFERLMTVAVLAAATLAPSAARAEDGSPFNVRFEKPFVLHGRTGIGVQKVVQKLRDNAWTENEPGMKSFQCDVTLSIEGRDLAKENTALGEHYFGSMQLECKRLWHKFSTRFSRVLFMGIRQCVQSETVYDQDYCTVSVVALQNERDRSLEAGDLIKVKDDKREFYRVHSAASQKAVTDGRVLPLGLNPATLVAYQSFEISVGKRGEDFFVKSPGATSNFARGANIYLTPDAAALANDQTRGAEVARQTDELARRLAAAQGERDALAKIEAMLPQFFTDFSAALKTSLGIISPVEFFQAENKLKALEQQLIATLRTYRPEITTRSQFRQRYASLAGEYRNLGEYLPGEDGVGPTPAPAKPSWQGGVVPAASTAKIDRLPSGVVRILTPGFKLDGREYLISTSATNTVEKLDLLCQAFGFQSSLYRDQWTYGTTTDDYDRQTGFLLEVDVARSKLMPVPTSRYDTYWSRMFCLSN